MTVIADVNANSRVARFEYRITEIAGREIKLLPKAWMAVRDVVLAILPQVLAISINDCRSVEVEAGHLFFIHRNHHDHVVLGRDLLHQLGRGTLRDALG